MRVTTIGEEGGGGGVMRAIDGLNDEGGGGGDVG